MRVIYEFENLSVWFSPISMKFNFQNKREAAVYFLIPEFNSRPTPFTSGLHKISDLIVQK